MNNETKIKSVIEEIGAIDISQYRYFHASGEGVPMRKNVIHMLKLIHSVLFPKFFPYSEYGNTEEERLNLAYELCLKEVGAALSFSKDKGMDARQLTDEVFGELARIKALLIKDAVAIYEGDPAAVSPEEVILCYPGFYAISIYRIAHEFYVRKIPLISRLMTEYGHEKTGVDIHAGATVGEYFCIDHGTGIVIGETATIGNRVKIYQGVTLGAKSFELGEDGNPIKGTKRHPDIGNGVIIYANATILGGRTHIGDGAIIGAGVWLTSSVEAGKTIYYTGNSKGN